MAQAAAIVERQEPFIGDPASIAKAWLALSIGEAERAATYRKWAEASRTQIERAKWTAEAEKQEEASSWHAGKAKEWRETIDD